MNAFKDLLSDPVAEDLLNRFLRYVKIETTSNRHVADIPSTQTQWQLSRLLTDELKAYGIQNVELDEHCYLIARVPASPGCEHKPTVGFLAHVDTASDMSGLNVAPRVIKNYDCSKVRLSDNMELNPSVYPDLLNHKGDSIIVTDGTTLLGADDKAGVAEIMAALRFFLDNPNLKHGPLEIIFTPDEETGKGMDLFPIEKINAKACYTIDGGKVGEIEAECFTAYEVKARFKGSVIHIGSARGKLANAVAMASTFATMLPRSESPEATDGWYGYYCPLEITGNLDSSDLSIYLRDFSDDGMARRIEACKAIGKAVEAMFPGGKVELDIKKQYLNMRKKLDEKPEVLGKAIEACEKLGIEAVIKPIRGGTDGARLTEKGIPTPNIFTGGYNFHSRFEWASLSEMVMATRVIVKIAELYAS